MSCELYGVRYTQGYFCQGCGGPIEDDKPKCAWCGVRLTVLTPTTYTKLSVTYGSARLSLLDDKMRYGKP